MPRALWNGEVIAESEAFELVEGSVYFPPETVHRQFLRPSATTTTCSWRGKASYYTLAVGDAQNPDAAWTYADPKPVAMRIKDYVAFWNGVTVER